MDQSFQRATGKRPTLRMADKLKAAKGAVTPVSEHLHWETPSGRPLRETIVVPPEETGMIIDHEPAPTAWQAASKLLKRLMIAGAVATAVLPIVQERGFLAVQPRAMEFMSEAGTWDKNSQAFCPSKDPSFAEAYFGELARDVIAITGEPAASRPQLAKCGLESRDPK